MGDSRRWKRGLPEGEVAGVEADPGMRGRGEAGAYEGPIHRREQHRYTGREPTVSAGKVSPAAVHALGGEPAVANVIAGRNPAFTTARATRIRRRPPPGIHGVRGWNVAASARDATEVEGPS